jgi:hypothetical protein
MCNCKIWIWGGFANFVLGGVNIVHATDWRCQLWYDVVVANAFRHGPLLSAAWGSGTECWLTHPPQTQSEKRIHLAIRALSRSCHRDPANASLLVRFIPEKLIFCEVLCSSSGRGEGQWICWPPTPSYPHLPQSFHLHSSTCVGCQILVVNIGDLPIALLVFLLCHWLDRLWPWHRV